MKVPCYQVEIISGEYQGVKGYTFDEPDDYVFKATVYDKDGNEYWTDVKNLVFGEKEDIEV